MAYEYENDFNAFPPDECGADERPPWLDQPESIPLSAWMYAQRRVVEAESEKLRLCGLLGTERERVRHLEYENALLRGEGGE